MEARGDGYEGEAFFRAILVCILAVSFQSAVISEASAEEASVRETLDRYFKAVQENDSSSANSEA